MNIGLLNEKVTFQKNELVVDAIGNHKNACLAFICGDGLHHRNYVCSCR